MIQKRAITIQIKKPGKQNAPKVITWKGITMVRNQSFLASVQEIVDYSEEMDVTRIGIIGDMHSGKTTLAKSLGHTIHKLSRNIPYTVRIFYKKDLLNFVDTLKSLNPTNYILIFDDVSFLKASATNKQINLIEQAITEIRHLEGGLDVKIICIFNYHYPKALPPFLREAQFKYITSIGDANEKNIADTYGKRNVDLITNFKMNRKKAIKDKVWYESIGPKDPVKYSWRDPFIPVIFWNETNFRKVVAPTRYFIDKICSDCDQAEGIVSYDEKTLQEIMEIGERTNEKGSFNTACKLLMFKHGYMVFNRNVAHALKWIERERQNRSIPLSAIATNRGFETRKTMLTRKAYDTQKSDILEKETEDLTI